MNISSAWGQLAVKIPLAALNKQKLLITCLDWHADYKSLLDESNFQVTDILSLKYQMYVDAEESCSLDEAVRVRTLTLPLPKQRPAENAARRLRDALESILAVKSDIACIRCGSGPLYAEIKTNSVFWVCSVCGKAQQDGVGMELDCSMGARLATPVEVFKTMKHWDEK